MDAKKINYCAGIYICLAKPSKRDPEKCYFFQDSGSGKCSFYNEAGNYCFCREAQQANDLEKQEILKIVQEAAPILQ